MSIQENQGVQRYVIYAETETDYEGNILGNYIDSVESVCGNWVMWDDVQALLSRIKELEAELNE